MQVVQMNDTTLLAKSLIQYHTEDESMYGRIGGAQKYDDEIVFFDADDVNNRLTKRIQPRIDTESSNIRVPVEGAEGVQNYLNNVLAYDQLGMARLADDFYEPMTVSMVYAPREEILSGMISEIGFFSVFGSKGVRNEPTFRIRQVYSLETKEKRKKMKRWIGGTNSTFDSKIGQFNRVTVPTMLQEGFLVHYKTATDHKQMKRGRLIQLQNNALTVRDAEYTLQNLRHLITSVNTSSSQLVDGLRNRLKFLDQISMGNIKINERIPLLIKILQSEQGVQYVSKGLKMVRPRFQLNNLSLKTPADRLIFQPIDDGVARCMATVTIHEQQAREAVVETVVESAVETATARAIEDVAAGFGLEKGGASEKSAAVEADAANESAKAQLFSVIITAMPYFTVIGEVYVVPLRFEFSFSERLKMEHAQTQDLRDMMFNFDVVNFTYCKLHSFEGKYDASKDLNVQTDLCYVFVNDDRDLLRSRELREVKHSYDRCLDNINHFSQEVNVKFSG